MPTPGKAKNPKPSLGLVEPVPNTPTTPAITPSTSSTTEGSPTQLLQQQSKSGVTHVKITWPSGNSEGLRMKDFKYVNKHQALGRGDQGTVYEVEHTPTGKHYALKDFQIKDMHDTSPQSCFSAFSSELVTFFQKVDTTHVVRVYDIYTNEEQRKMKVLMELMDLGSLTDVLFKLKATKTCPNGSESYGRTETDGNDNGQRYGRLCNWDLCYLARSILKAVHALHTKGIIHRDLKPSNVLVNSRGEIKVCDFGVSKLLEATNQLATTTTGSQLFFAPERIVPGKGYSFPADIWSVGVFLGYCAVGQHPISEKVFDVMTKVSDAGFQLTLPTDLGLDEDFVNLVKKCCTNSTVERPTAEKLLAEDPFLKKYPCEGEGGRPKFLDFVTAPS